MVRGNVEEYLQTDQQPRSHDPEELQPKTLCEEIIKLSKTVEASIKERVKLFEIIITKKPRELIGKMNKCVANILQSFGELNFYRVNCLAYAVI